MVTLTLTPFHETIVRGIRAHLHVLSSGPNIPEIEGALREDFRILMESVMPPEEAHKIAREFSGVPEMMQNIFGHFREEPGIAESLKNLAER